MLLCCILICRAASQALQEKSKAEADLEARIAELNKQMSDKQKLSDEERNKKAYNSLGKIYAAMRLFKCSSLYGQHIDHIHSFQEIKNSNFKKFQI